MLLTGARPFNQGINSLRMQRGLRERDRNMVLNLGDPRRCPGSFLCRLFLRIGMDRPIEDDLAALHFDRDTAGIELLRTDEPLVVVLAQVGLRETRPGPGEIADASVHCTTA